jgi:hypothetical protein
MLLARAKSGGRRVLSEVKATAAGKSFYKEL